MVTATTKNARQKPLSSVTTNPGEFDFSLHSTTTEDGAQGPALASTAVGANAPHGGSAGTNGLQRLVKAFSLAWLMALDAETLEELAIWIRHQTIDFNDAQAFVEQNRPVERWVKLPVGTRIKVVGTKHHRKHLVGHEFEVTDSNGYVIGIKDPTLPDDAYCNRYMSIFLPEWTVRIVSLPEAYPVEAYFSGQAASEYVIQAVAR